MSARAFRQWLDSMISVIGYMPQELHVCECGDIAINTLGVCNRGRVMIDGLTLPRIVIRECGANCDVVKFEMVWDGGEKRYADEMLWDDLAELIGYYDEEDGGIEVTVEDDSDTGELSVDREWGGAASECDEEECRRCGWRGPQDRGCRCWELDEYK